MLDFGSLAHLKLNYETSLFLQGWNINSVTNNYPIELLKANSTPVDQNLHLSSISFYQFRNTVNLPNLVVLFLINFENDISS